MYSLISRGSQSRSCEFLDGVVKLLSGCQKIQGDIRTDSPKGVTMSSIFSQYHEREKDRLFKQFDQGCDFYEKRQMGISQSGEKAMSDKWSNSEYWLESFRKEDGYPHRQHQQNHRPLSCFQMHL